jgi:hypothetical protein
MTQIAGSPKKEQQPKPKSEEGFWYECIDGSIFLHCILQKLLLFFCTKYLQNFTIKYWNFALVSTALFFYVNCNLH